jgi:hypothetical protein
MSASLRAKRDATPSFLLYLARSPHGAVGDVIEWVTHPRDGDVLDSYTTPTWSLLCRKSRS